MTNRGVIRKRWRLIRPYLDARQRNLWAATEATIIGRGGCKLIAHVTGLSAPVISTWKHKLQLGRRAPPGSLAQAQRSSYRSGRRFIEAKDPHIIPTLELMLKDELAGNPITNQRWVRSSLRNLSSKLKEKGHQACTHTVARLLRNMGYSLQVNVKKRTGAQHPHRDIQFKYITELKEQFIQEGLPIISIDTKKKELIGNYRREGHRLAQRTHRG